jgi:hypothetical protein
MEADAIRLPLLESTRLSGHRIAQDAVRGFKALDQVGEGHGRQDEPPIDCCVVVIFCIILRDQ